MVCVIQGWWIVALPVVFVSSWRFPLFIEILIAGVAYDSLFGFTAHSGLWGYVGTITSIAILGLTLFFKSILRK